jgi:hypothetical protein
MASLKGILFRSEPLRSWQSASPLLTLETFPTAVAIRPAQYSISDTHGLIRPEALDALRDSDLIIHCGDAQLSAGLLFGFWVSRAILTIRCLTSLETFGRPPRQRPRGDPTTDAAATAICLHRAIEPYRWL